LGIHKFNSDEDKGSRESIVAAAVKQIYLVC